MSSLKEKKIRPDGIDKVDFVRIKSTFEQWWTSVLVLTFTFITTYVCWVSISQLLPQHKIQAMLASADISDSVKALLMFSIVLISSVVRGLLYCADGLVASWLKAPFGQICHSINSSGLEYSEANEIVERLTEINEHFKETFKKFGIMTIGAEIALFVTKVTPNGTKDRAVSVAKHSTQSQNLATSLFWFFCSPIFIQLASSFALMIPIFFAGQRVQICREKIDSMKVIDE